MSGLDASFYLIEDENTPLHVAATIVLEGPPPAYGDVVRLITARLPSIERYRQRVRAVPFHLSRPVWVDDPHFQILYHVRHTAVPAPGTADQLRNLAGRILAQRLDPKKPLWELWIVEGLEDGKWAVIAKVHHCMVDGVAGMDLMTQLFDITPEYTLPEIEEWDPAPEPSGLALLVDALRDNVMQPVRAASSLPALAGSVRRAPEILDYAGGLVRHLSRFAQSSASVLNGPIGPHRRWSWVSADLDEVREIRKALGGTVNDVVLAAVTRGFRDQLAGRDALSPGTVVRAGVPVSVRTEGERGELNNRVSAVFVNLPVGVEDPVRRYDLLRAQMDDLKATGQETAGVHITRLTDVAVAPALMVLSARTPIRLFNGIVQTVVTNIPGPQFPLYVLGRQVEAMYPYVPLTGGIQVATAIFSYLGRLYFGVSADFDGQPDVDTLAKGVRAGFDELLGAERP